MIYFEDFPALLSFSKMNTNYDKIDRHFNGFQSFELTSFECVSKFSWNVKSKSKKLSTQFLREVNLRQH